MRTIEEIKAEIENLTKLQIEYEQLSDDADTDSGSLILLDLANSCTDKIDALKWVLNESV